MNKLVTLVSCAVAAISLAACSDDTSAQQRATTQQANLQANHDAQFNARCEAGHLISQEIRNLCDRAKRINVQNMQSCITLFANNGSLVAFFPVKGKVSSLNSYLLPGDQAGGYSSAPYVTEAPDIDGAYGKNADGIFFFTADTDAYVEWQGDYFWSDQCLTPATAPLLVRQTK